MKISTLPSFIHQSLTLALSVSLVLSSVTPAALAEDATSSATAETPEESAITLKMIDKITAPLLALKRRPSVDEVLAIVPRWVMTNEKARELLEERAGRGPADPQVLDEQLAKHIAQIEMIMPKATYAYLGRDSALPADLVEGFYQYIGQHHRAVRLNASTSSFRYASPEIMNDFLETNGLNFNEFPESNGFLILDVTSYGRNSQSTMLVNNALSKLTSLNYDSRVIARKFNLGDLHGRGLKVSSADMLQTALKSQSRKVAKNSSFGSTIATPLKSMTYTAEWHGTFRPFRRYKGMVLTAPGEVNNMYMRKITLATMLLGLGHVMQDDFVETVLLSATDDFHYEFPDYSQKISDISATISSYRLMNADDILNLRLQKMRNPSDQSWYRLLSKRRIRKANSKILVKWFQDNGQGRFLDARLLEAALRSYNEGKIGFNELSDLVGISMARYKLSPEYVAAFEKLADANPIMKKVFAYTGFYLGSPLTANARLNATDNFSKLKPLIPQPTRRTCNAVLLNTGA